MARCAAGGRTHAARLTALLLLARCRTSPGAEQAMPKGVFDFGSNWHDFVAQLTLSGDRSSEIYDAINAAMWQLARTISPIGFDIEEGIPDKTVFANSSFLDIGCGSGIHSASAAFLGSPHITSFDIQEGSVMATNVMKEVLQPLFKGSSWEVRQGSILQQESLEALSADVVYSWGVLHHTGQMWDAIRNACRAVPRPEDGGGVLFVALYALEVVRDVDYWIRVKTKYLAEPEEGKKQMEREYAWFVLKDAAINGNKNPFGMIYENPLQRGMDFWTDVKDWLGGLPIEFSEAHEVIRFVRQQCGLVPARVVPSTVTEFIFVTDPEDPRLVPTDERLVGRWHESMRSMTTIELRPPFTWLDLSAERRRVCFAVKLALPEHLNTSTVLFDLKEDGYDFGFGIELEEERRLEALDEMFESEEVQLQQKRREWVARFGPDGHTCERPGRYFRQLWSWSGEAVVVFSTSDGSDPNKNGRRYSVHIEPGTGEPPAPAASQREILYSSADLQWTRHGMTDADMAAIDAIAAHSDSPLVDMSRFPFFGGKEALAPSASLGSWVLPEFAPRLAEMDPLLAAALRMFHDEFSQGLIHPDNPNVFKGHELSGDERERLKALKAVFDSSGVEAYARGLRADEGLWNKVVDYKQPTVSAFAVGACDGPLCDQLLFMGEWLAKEQPTWLKADAVGRWKADRNTGFTSVVNAADGGDAGGPRAVQPSLRRPKDEGVTQRLREVTQEYVFRHLAAIRGCGGGAPG